jgi:transposase
MNFLKNDERAQLKIQHKQERDGRIRDRIKAVLLSDKGWTTAEIAEALFLSEDAIRDHVTEYKNSQKLKPENGGSTQKLSIERSNELVAHLRSHTYLYVKDIIAYVQSTWSVTYSVPGMRNWLQRYGFSYKKPALVPGKADGQQQREWMAQYEKLKQNLPDDETICFMDGVHPTHNVQPAYGWIQKGVRKEIPANTGRSWMKERVIYNTYYREFEDFKTSVFGFFEALAKLNADSILGREFRKRIRDRFRPLAAPI